MMLFSAFWLSLLALAGPATAADWYFLRFWAADGQSFTSLSGDMDIPPLQQAGTYYLWPGLQPTDDTGVYQNVLDGTSGTWWFGSGWCCSNPDLPWGSGFNTYEGETNSFSNTLDGGSWTTTIVHGSTGTTDTDTFDLGEFRPAASFSGLP